MLKQSFKLPNKNAENRKCTDPVDSLSDMTHVKDLESFRHYTETRIDNMHVIVTKKSIKEEKMRSRQHTYMEKFLRPPSISKDESCTMT